MKGERFLISREVDTIRVVLIPKLSRPAGIDAEVLRGRKPSKDIEATRKEWTEEFEKRVRQT
ncbi:MAG: hypothetical protein QXO25_04590 [Candidatus Bathyarchaeia archaeon]